MKFALPPSRDDVLSQLFIGAPPLEMVDYSNFVSLNVQSVNIYFKFEYDRGERTFNAHGTSAIISL